MDGSTNCLTLAPERPVESRAAPLKDQNSAAIAAPIVVAVDMSGDSRAALLWACEYAANADVPVTALHVIHDPAETPGKYSRSTPDPLTPMVDTAEKMLVEFMAEVRTDHPELERLAEARTKVTNGLPARTVVEEAVRLNANLIVIGSRGQSGLPRLLNGSTAQRIVRLSPIPVTVVKAQGW